MVTKVATDDVQRLARAGERRVIWRGPTEHPESRPIGAVLTSDDLLEWHQQLETPGWLEAEVGKLSR